MGCGYRVQLPSLTWREPTRTLRGKVHTCFRWLRSIDQKASFVFVNSLKCPGISYADFNDQWPTHNQVWEEHSLACTVVLLLTSVEVELHHKTIEFALTVPKSARSPCRSLHCELLSYFLNIFSMSSFSSYCKSVASVRLFILCVVSYFAVGDLSY